MPDESLVLEGSFETFSIDEVLDVVGLSRQYLELVLADDAASGSILVKSGNVLRASRPPRAEGRDAFVRLYRRPGASFQVFRRAQAGGAVEPIGSLSDLIRLAREAAEAPAGQLVLEGTFDQFTLIEVLEVIGLSRQSMALSLDSGEVLVKSGRVVWATTRDGATGEEAFFALYRAHGTGFRVTHRTDEPLESDVAPLRELLERARTGGAGDAVIVSGELDAFTVDQVFQVAGLSRQLLEVTFRDDAGTVGAVVLKAGQVLEAEAARSGSHGRRAFAELYARPGSRFTVVRRPPSRRYGTPIASLADLVADARSHSVGQPEVSREVVAEGALADFSLREVLDVVGISRQFIEVELRRAGHVVGSMLVKGGQLLEVHHHMVRGDARAILTALLADPGTHFTVFHRSAPSTVPEPVGSLAALLAVPADVHVDEEDVTVVAPRTVTPAPLASRDPTAAALQALDDEMRRQGEQIAELARARDEEAAQLVEALHRSGDRLLLGALLVTQLATMGLVLVLVALALT